MTLDGQSHPLPDHFMVVATQNPIEHQGVYPLPEAQLDRFLFKLLVPYPSAEEEAAIVRRFGERSAGAITCCPTTSRRSPPARCATA